MWMIRPKRIYFLEHFAIVSPLNLCDLDTTNTDRRCFQQNYLGVLFLCRKSTIRKNLGKYAKNYISPEDPRSQKTRRRGGLGGTPMPGTGPPLAAPRGCRHPRHPLGLPLRL